MLPEAKKLGWPPNGPDGNGTTVTGPPPLPMTSASAVPAAPIPAIATAIRQHLRNSIEVSFELCQHCNKPNWPSHSTNQKSPRALSKRLPFSTPGSAGGPSMKTPKLMHHRLTPASARSATRNHRPAAQYVPQGEDQSNPSSAEGAESSHAF